MASISLGSHTGIKARWLSLRELLETDIDPAWKLWHLFDGVSAVSARNLRQSPWSSGWGSLSESERVA